MYIDFIVIFIYMGGICFILYIWLDEIVWYLFRVNIPSSQYHEKPDKNKDITK